MGRSMPGRSSPKRLARRRPERPQADEAACDTAQVITSVAQGLVQAQQQAAAPQTEQEILRLLQQIEQHLAAEKNNAGGDAAVNWSGEAAGPDTAGGRPNMLRQLLTALQSRAGGQQNQGGTASGGVSAGLNQGGSRAAPGQGGGQDLPGGTGTGQGQQAQAGAGNGTGGGQNPGGRGDASLDPQAAAQLLSQAQYELANELEASLQKLRQVINESEKIAAKVSTLLQQEGQQQQGQQQQDQAQQQGEQQQSQAPQQGQQQQ